MHKSSQISNPILPITPIIPILLSLDLLLRLTQV